MSSAFEFHRSAYPIGANDPGKSGFTVRTFINFPNIPPLDKTTAELAQSAIEKVARSKLNGRSGIIDIDILPSPEIKGVSICVKLPKESWGTRIKDNSLTFTNTEKERMGQLLVSSRSQRISQQALPRNQRAQIF